MSNNFNLRTFLSENKLTKNSKVLNEEYGYEKFMDTVADFYDEGTDEYEDLKDAVLNAWEKGDIYSQPHEPSTYKAQVIGVAKEIGLDPEVVNEANYSDSYESDAAKKAISKIKSAESPDKAAVDQMIASAEEETGTKVSDLERRVLHRQANWINTQDSEMERESVEPSLAESKQSARDKRIVEMVQRALGIPAPVSEDEMVQENPLPKYSSIDELMKDIEHGTNEAAHKYKMDKMKSVYEALEAKVGSLEEGEHAEHIDQKAIKQMRKDIAALRKAEEKLRKEYDKKFAVKEKPAKKEAE